ncbi:MAG TPA: hypothetical protein VN132_08175, partial [Bdellovibrio sp.]|nr:hypothetical protein [Bdellovibrio sp.]
MNQIKLLLIFVIFFSAGLATARESFALSSANIPLDSPIYSYLEKLEGLGLITSDVRGVRPYSKAEAARLVLEAERNMAAR